MTWAKGVSGNPAGKAPGTESKITKLRNMIAARVPDIIDRLIESAINGDTQAAKLLIERALPAYRTESMPINLAITEKLNLVEIGNKIISAIGNGEMSPDQGTQLLLVLSNQAKLIEVTDLEQRIKALEEASNSKS